MSYTSHYGLRKLRQGDHLSDDSYKFTDADRDIMDLALYLGAEGHHHIGDGAASSAPDEAPNVQLVTTSGTLPAGKRIFYRYTLIDASGAESAPSPEVFIDTPTQVVAPGKPTLDFAATGGTLQPGSYYYVLSAYTGSSTYETAAINPSYLAVTGTATTNTITITLPALPSGASGFNIYRQAPGGPGYFFIASVDMTVATPPTTYVDDGSVAPNCDRTRPTVNTTLQSNSVILSLPGATPSLAPGQSWRIYRTMVVGDYTNSNLATISDSVTYTDTGTATGFGQPPATGLAISSPSKILLTDAAETQGRLPLSSVSAFPYVLSFALEGDVFPLIGTTVWVCEYPQATIVGVRAALGRDSTPATQDIIVDVNVGAGATPTMTSIFTDQADQPRIVVGAQVGTRVVPTADAELIEGDVLTIDVDQAGGGGTPTDRDLVVQVYLLAYGWTSPLSHVWS